MEVCGVRAELITRGACRLHLANNGAFALQEDDRHERIAMHRILLSLVTSTIRENQNNTKY
jgi:hypothetical protein